MMRRRSMRFGALAGALLMTGIGTAGFAQPAGAADFLGFFQSIAQDAATQTDAAVQTEENQQPDAAAQTADDNNAQADMPEDTGERIECGGFDTPDEAILAFAAGLQEGDLDKMISTFAIESYCEHFDQAGQIQRLAALQPTMLITGTSVVAPALNELMAQISVESRKADICGKIKMPLMMIALDQMMFSDDPFQQGAAEALSGMMPYYGDELQQVTLSELQQVLEAMQNIPDFSSLTVSNPISMLALASMNEHYLTRNNLKNMFTQGLIANAQGYTERGVILEGNGEFYLVTMSMIRYGDKWFNYQLGGNISILMNIEAYRQGIIGGDLTALGVDSDSAEEEMLRIRGELLNPVNAVGSYALLTGLDETAAEFDEEHQALLTQLQSGRDEDDNILDISAVDFSQPLISQIEALKTMADNSGISFYRSDLTDVAVMTFDEMKDYFALQ